MLQTTQAPATPDEADRADRAEAQAWWRALELLFDLERQGVAFRLTNGVLRAGPRKLVAGPVASTISDNRDRLVQVLEDRQAGGW